jgi:exonuclease I
MDTCMALLPEREYYTIVPVVHIYLPQCPMLITASGVKGSFDAQRVGLDGWMCG